VLPDLERRSVVELRGELAPRPRIVGHAVIFDTRSQDLGGFVEVVRASAVDRSLTGDVRCLYNHDPGAVLGRTPTTLTLTKETRGLAFELDPAQTQAGRDAFELVRRGDIRGASFGFRTLKDAWQRDGRVVIRELLDVEILEISLTAFPSYQQTDVSVAQRALQAANLSARGQVPSIHWLRMQARVR